MLNISRLTLGYNNKPLLGLERFNVPAHGEYLIAGASGCGKTTLLYAIAGLIPVMEGSITIEGVNITKLTQRQRDHFRGRMLGIIFQTLHLVPSLTVLENLLLGLYAVGLPQDKPRAESLLHQLGLYDKRHAMPHVLSQGQAQRVAIMRSLLHRPKLILADEPTSSLDDANTETVIELIRATAQECNAALVICTHDSRVKKHFNHVLTLGNK